jgi:hypothetical protein
MSTHRAIAMLLLLAGASASAGAATVDTRAYLRADGGYDFFDLSGSLLGWSSQNTKHSYDYFDRTGAFLGWSAALTPGRTDFHDAAGVRFRTIENDVSGNVVVLDELGIIRNYGASNYRGGSDVYTHEGLPSGIGTPSSYDVTGRVEPGEE